MDYAGIPLFNLMKSKLDFMSQRQAVLAQNIANADTPGYKAKDIKEPNFYKLISANGAPPNTLKLAATTAGHILTSATNGSDFKIVKRHSTDELNPNGNNVAIEDEMSKVGQNQAEYQKVLNLYSKAISLFKVAIGNPNTGS